MRVGKALTGLRKRLEAAAWHKWKFGKHIFQSEEDDDGGDIIGKGSALLIEAGRERKVSPTSLMFELWHYI